MIDAKSLQEEFPILGQEVNDEPLVYLDNAATTQKPKAVLQTIEDYYYKDNANVHRGVHSLAERATKKYEAARKKVRQLIHAHERAEVLFTRGTTTSLNWIAQSFGDAFIHEGDEIVISYMEHHSNVVPWQQLAKRRKAVLKYIPLTKDGFLDIDEARKQITDKTALVAIAHASNVLGVINPIEELTQLAHKHQAVIAVDGAQAVPHMPVDVEKLDV
ncbi:aminotransferase class V-fold PLP-dependent enzyme, partial [Tetragenococcus halophilus]